MSNQMTEQAVVVTQAAIAGAPGVKKLALFNPDGSPYSVPEVVVPLTLAGYEIAEAVAALETTDTVNEAFGKLERAVSLEDYAPAVAAGPVLETDTLLEAIGKLERAVSLEDYAPAETAGPVLETDTLLEAIAKLEKRLADVEGTLEP